MVNSRMLCGLGQRMLALTGPRGYWPILHFKRIHNMTTGNTALFRNASRYWGKPVLFPYLEPLVFYVSAYFRRPLGDVLNPKGHLKRQYHYLRHSQSPWPHPRASLSARALCSPGPPDAWKAWPRSSSGGWTPWCPSPWGDRWSIVWPPWPNRGRRRG